MIIYCLKLCYIINVHHNKLCVHNNYIIEKGKIMEYRDDKQVEFVCIGLSDNDMDKYKKNSIEYNKQIGTIMREAKRNAKENVCFVCKKQVNGFCNSHFVPQFCLKRIPVNGIVQISGFPDDFTNLENISGANSVGTFQLICRECNSKIFQRYENSLSYNEKPPGQVLAQIAMKNYLHLTIYF